jgi:predicted nucleic acid-binding Zn ribbon protein
MKCLMCGKEFEAMASADGFCSADCRARHDENIHRLKRWTQYILIILGLMIKWLDQDAYQDLAAGALLRIEDYMETNLNSVWPDRRLSDDAKYLPAERISCDRAEAMAEAME